jgi:hypothetical protein
MVGKKLISLIFSERNSRLDSGQGNKTSGILIKTGQK